MAKRQENLKEFEVTITETFIKRVCVMAEDWEDAQDIAETSCNEGEEDKFDATVDYDDFTRQVDVEEVTI